MSTQTLKHPVGLVYCFMTEMWERFSFYGLQALLLLYMVNKLHLGSQGPIIFGDYVTYVYITTAIGGIIADRLIGYRRCVMLGGSSIVAGNILLTLSFLNPALLFLGLGFISAGTGLFKANVTVIVGKLYDDREALRSSGFAYFYAGINLGSLIATFLVGWVGLSFGWNWGFLLAAIGMCFGLFMFTKGRKHFPDVVENYNPIIKKKYAGITLWYWLLIGIIVIALIFAYIIAHPVAANIVTLASLVILVVYISTFWKKLNGKEKKGVFMILFLSIFMVLFWGFNNQQSSSFPIFIQDFVGKTIGHHVFLTTTIMGAYLIILTILNPILAFIWQKLAGVGKEPSDELKFVLSLLFLAFGFGVLVLGGHTLPMNLRWIMFCYTLLALGELCISPVGLSLVTRLAPKHLSSTMMGIWWTISAYAGWIGGQIGSYADKSAHGYAPGYGFIHIYFMVFIASLILAIILFVLLPFVRKMQAEKEMKMI